MNNLFSKTIKTFLTSVFISLFVFGSFYFLLSSDTQTEEIKVSEKKQTPKLVINENNSTKNEDVLGTTSNSSNLIAQLSDDYNAPVVTTPTNQIMSPTVPAVPAIPVAPTVPAIVMPVTTIPSVIAPTLPSTGMGSAGGTTATGVPRTGNEALYLVIAAFSIISGFLIVNGKSLAYRSFERM